MREAEHAVTLAELVHLVNWHRNSNHMDQDGPEAHLGRLLGSRRDSWQMGAGSDPLNKFDPRVAMAAYLAGKFEQAGWRAVYDQPTAPSEAESGAKGP